MSAVDLLVILGGVVVLAGAVAMWVCATRLLAAAADLREAAAEFTATAQPLTDHLADSAERAAAEVDRVEHLLDLSTGIAQRLDGTTGATYRAIATPVIKGAALAEGTKQVARRLGRPGRAGGR